MIEISADDVTLLGWAVGGSAGRYADGMLYPTPEAEAVLADPNWRDGARGPSQDPTPLQIIEEMEARESEGRIPTLTAFLAAMTEAERLKFTAAQGTISRMDRRIARFGQAFGMSPAEIAQFMDDAAARTTTEL